MKSLSFSVEEFSARRRKAQDEYAARLTPLVEEALATRDFDELLHEQGRIFVEVYRDEAGIENIPPSLAPTLARLARDSKAALEKSTPESEVAPTALLLATAALNTATMAAADADPEELVLEWVTMHDNAVREAHADTDGQQRPAGEPFDVAGVEMPYPGFPGAPIALWINCRCVLRPALIEDALLADANKMQDETESTEYAQTRTDTPGAAMTETITEPVPDEEFESPDDAEVPDEPVDTRIPWHGVLAPDNVRSGDGRKFTNLGRTRDLPLPLTWQEVSSVGHENSISVAMIEKVQMIDGLMHASGHFLSSVDEADEVIGLIAEFGRFGVSVDADDVVEMAFDEEEGTEVYDDPRICSAAIVSIPAFAEAYVALGPHPILDDDQANGDVTEPEQTEFRDVSQDERDERAEDGTAMPDGSYPIANCEDLKNAIQAIGRAKDPAATKRHIKKRKSALGCPDVDLPEGWSAETLTDAEKVAAIRAKAETESWADIEGFKDLAPGKTEDGPGWLTHPVDTDRLRDYWVRGPGAAKIGWGVSGDFNRCRVNLAEYVKPQYLNGYCANRHYDALGVWPGREASAADLLTATDAAPALNLVAAGGWGAPSEWFTEPTDVPEGEGVVITDEGRISGYIAEWGVCHIGLSGVCTEAPPSYADYSYFRTGTVETPDGPVKVGTLTVATGHAEARLAAGPAVAHYDNTGTGFAYVACGENARGIWFSGMLRPGLDEDTISEVKAAGRLSGDWRGIGGNLELVAALAINTPGFPVIKTSLVAGAQISLIAAGVVGRKTTDEPDSGVVSEATEALASAIVNEMESRQARRARMAALREKVND